MTTYAYVRTSTEDQSATPAEQELAIRNAFEVDEVVLEETPGRLIRRPALDALIDRLQPSDLVVVHRIDRLARGPEVTEPILRRIWSKGATAESVDERGALADSTFGYQQRGITGVMAGAETKRSAERQQDGKRSIARNGTGLPWGRLPYGIQLDPTITKQDFDSGVRRYVETPDADVVRRIFIEWNRGVAVSAIADALNYDGIPSPNAGQKWRDGKVSGRWSKPTLFHILSNPAYVGIADQGRTKHIPNVSEDGALIPGGRRIARSETDEGRAIGTLPASVMPSHVLTDEIFEAAQQGLAERRGNTKRRTSSAGHPFTGIARCGTCGAGLHWRRRSNRDADVKGRLMCPNGWGKAPICDAPARCDEEALLVAFVQSATAVAAAPADIDHERQDERQQDAQALVASIDAKLYRLRSLLIEGDIEPEEHHARKSSLDSQRVEAVRQGEAGTDRPVVLDAWADLQLVSPIVDDEQPLPDSDWPIWTVLDGTLYPERLLRGTHVVAMPSGDRLAGWLRTVAASVTVDGITGKGQRPDLEIDWR